MLPLGKYLTVLPPPQAYKSWNSGKISYIYRRLTLFVGWGRIEEVGHVVIFPNLFQEFLSIFLYFLSLMQRLAETVEVLFLISLLTYPMINWCILRKYISRPLLLLQSVPCRHTGSEMYLKPSRPRMHANSASRRKYFSVLQRLASCVTRLSGSCCFPQ